jgi:hypothetical protein
VLRPPLHLAAVLRPPPHLARMERRHRPRDAAASRRNGEEATVLGPPPKLAGMERRSSSLGLLPHHTGEGARGLMADLE